MSALVLAGGGALARRRLEQCAKTLLFCSASISIAITILIVLSVLIESINFFAKVPVFDFLFGTHWSPQTSIRADQAGSTGSFGFIPVFAGTLLITVIAMLLATPLGLFSAIYLSEYSSRKFRDTVKPILEILAGIPTVVYGYFAVVVIAPLFRQFGDSIGLGIASESALVAGLVMGVMIIPFILSLSDDVMNSVPNSLRDASLALGATKAETVKKVVLPAAFPGIMSAVLLGISRAIGETMVVVMAAGLTANLTVNPLEPVTTVTVQIVTLLIGDQEFDSAKTLAAFSLGLTLLIITLILNIIALQIVKNIVSNMIKVGKKLDRKRKAYKKLMRRKRINRKVSQSLYRRHAAEFRLKLYGISAIVISLFFLLALFYNIISNGYSAFIATEIKVPITYKEGASDRAMMNAGIKQLFPNVKGRRDKINLYRLVSQYSQCQIEEFFKDNKPEDGKTYPIWIYASSDVDMFLKGKIKKTTPEHMRKLNNTQIGWIESLEQQSRVRTVFNRAFFKMGDSQEPESAGVLGSLLGSFFIIISCMALAFPLGVLTATYLEEFAPKNKLTDFIEVNINNLASVPSIVFGLLGLTIYLQFFEIPRSAALAGGLTLALLALPVIVISTRTAIKAVPPSIKDGAYALGATQLQTVIHHTLPLAMPGIMTGTILSIARILGETAPLLMIGMMAFVVEVPTGFLDPSTALPAQIYQWSDRPELGFVEKTSAAIIILLILLVIANALAVYLRKKFEIRW